MFSISSTDDRGGVLVYRVGQLGDAVVALPALHAIRAKHPDAPLYLLTDAHPNRALVSSADVFQHTGYFRDVIRYAPATNSLRERLRLAIHLRRLRIGRMYYLAPWRSRRQVARDWVFFRWIAGVRRVEGLRDALPAPRDGAGHLRRLENESRRLLRIVDRAAPRDPEAFIPTFRVGANARQSADGWLVRPIQRGATPVVALAPGSKMPAKQWPMDRYRRLGSLILARYPDSHIVLIGGPADREISGPLQNEWGDRCTDVTGRLTVEETVAALQRCELFVGNDSGPMHLAAAVGVPCVAIFSARENPGIWEPLGRDNVVLRREVSCQGCMLEVCSRPGHPCLTRIAVDEVLAAIASVVDGRARNGRDRSLPIV